MKYVLKEVASTPTWSLAPGNSPGCTQLPCYTFTLIHADGLVQSRLITHDSEMVTYIKMDPLSSPVRTARIP